MSWQSFTRSVEETQFDQAGGIFSGLVLLKYSDLQALSFCLTVEPPLCLPTDLGQGLYSQVGLRRE